MSYVSILNRTKRFLTLYPIVGFYPEDLAVQYQVIDAPSLLDLEKFVNNELRHDWSVTGGLIVYLLDTGDEMLAQPRAHFAQAMIRNQPQPKKT